jgi:hypothetical protein
MTHKYEYIIHTHKNKQLDEQHGTQIRVYHTYTHTHTNKQLEEQHSTQIRVYHTYTHKQTIRGTA